MSSNNRATASWVCSLVIFVIAGCRMIVNKLVTEFYKRAIPKVGAGFRAQWPCVIRSCQQVRVGYNVTIGPYSRLGSEDLKEASLILNDNVQINRHAHIDFSGGLKIGSGTVISDGVMIYTHSHGYSPHNEPVPKPLEIGANVWIGAGAVVLENVNFIGEGSVIGAGSVVTRDLPECVVVGGVPAKILKVIKPCEC